MMTMKIIKLLARTMLFAVTAFSLASCASHIKRGDEYAVKDEWTKAILEYRKAYSENPYDIAIKSRVKQMELKAAEYFYHRGAVATAAGDIDGAIGLFQQGLVAMPDNEKLIGVMKDAQLRKEAAAIYREGENLLNAGKQEDAKQRFKKALEVYPGHGEAAMKLAEIENQELGAAREGLALSSSAPITLNFRETDIRDAYEFLAKSFGVNVIFDDGVKSVPVTLFAKNVTFEQGLGLLLATSKTFYRKIGPNTILLALDNKEKHSQYEDHLVRTFALNTVRAKEMSDILKGVFTVKKIVINEQLNTITIRDSEEIIRLAERVIQNNDKKPAEVILEVEILEINRTKAENLGLDFGGYQVTAAVPPYPLGSSFAAAKSTGTLTIPSATLHFFKQDVDAKTLANPRIRVISGKPAKIHIGDRVPLIATTIQDATGQVRNTFDYKDIGIRLTTEPTVNLDNSVAVKLGLEVSTLGQNLGTASQPAYSIGSRNAETFMLLRDGETAILGGLIQDNERNSKILIPGLGDIPAAGAIFTSYNNSGDRSDVLLTITPRVVRGWEQTTESERQFHSGTENAYYDRQLFAEHKVVAVSEAGSPLTPKINTNGKNTNGAAEPAALPVKATLPAAPVQSVKPSQSDSPAQPQASPQLGFSEAVYEVTAGQELSIKLTSQNLGGVASLPIEILYNAKVMSFVRGEAGDPSPQSFSAAADGDKGVISVKLVYAPNTAPKDSAMIANLVMHADNPGISYLIYRTKTLSGASGETINAQVRASRVVVN